MRVVSKDLEAGITDTQIYRFTQAGAQVEQNIGENVDRILMYFPMSIEQLLVSCKKLTITIS